MEDAKVCVGGLTAKGTKSTKEYRFPSPDAGEENFLFSAFSVFPTPSCKSFLSSGEHSAEHSREFLALQRERTIHRATGPQRKAREKEPLSRFAEERFSCFMSFVLFVVSFFFLCLFPSPPRLSAAFANLYVYERSPGLFDLFQ